MASRAFFRCRACGEPVTSGAYRCPVCGIDFPSGTPGAPTAADSPAAVDLGGTKARSTRTVDIEVEWELEGALGKELADEPEPDEPAPRMGRRTGAAAPDPAPGATPEPPRPDGSRADPSVSGRSHVPGSTKSEDPDVGAEDSDPHDEAGEPPSDMTGRDLEDFDVAAIVPGEQRAPRRESGLTVAPAPPRRPRRVVVAEPLQREVIDVPRRRSKVGDLAGTVTMAMLLLAVIGGAAVYLEQNGLARFGIFERARSALGGAAPITVTAEDGWVTIPAEPGTVLIDADGIYRIRVDGEVFTGSANQRVRVPVGETTSLAVRTVRAPTTATVSRAE